MPLPEHIPHTVETFRTPVEAREAFKEEVSFEEFLKQTREENMLIELKSFESEEAASQVLNDRVDTLNAALITHPKWLKTRVSISGQGVREPNFQTVNATLTDGKKAIVVSIDEEAALEEVSPFDTRQGILESVMGHSFEVEDTEENTIDYRVRFEYIFRDSTGAVSNIVIGDSGISIIRILAQPIYLASVSEATLEVSILNRVREKNKLIDDMIRHGMVVSGLKAKLDTLHAAFANESSVDFIHLRKVGLMHSISRLALKHAQGGAEAADLTRQVILDVINPQVNL